MTTPQIQFDDPDLWTQAKGYVRSIGGLPLFLTSTVRAVRNARILFGDDSSEDFKNAIAQAIRRLLLSPSYKAAFYAAAQEYYPQRVSSLGGVGGREVLEVFSADEVCAIIFSYYLYRRLVNLTSEEDFGPLVARVRTSLALGHLVGHLIEELGPGNAMVISVSQVFALGLLCKKSPKEFKEYRRKMRTVKSLYSPDLEAQFFQTTSQHVAASLIQASGYGTSAAVGMYCEGVPRPTRPLDHTMMLWAKSRRIMEVLQYRGASIAADELSHLDVVGRGMIDEVLVRVTDITENVECSQWLFVGKQDGLELLESNKAIPEEITQEEETQ